MSARASRWILGLFLAVALPTMANADEDVKPIPAPAPAEYKAFTIPGGGAFRPNVKKAGDVPKRAARVRLAFRGLLS